MSNQFADHVWSPWGKLGHSCEPSWLLDDPGFREAVKVFGRGKTFFVPCDWLDPEAPVELLAKFLGLIHATPNIRWLLLTKRPDNFRDRVHQCVKDGPIRSIDEWASNWLYGDAPSNVWVGNSASNQPEADERIPALLRIPAAGRFLCLDPLVGSVDVFSDQTGELLHVSGDEYNPGRIDWVIISGDTGPDARPCNVDWIRSLVGQCKAAGVPCWVERLGAVATEEMFEHAPDCDDADCALNGGVGDCAGSVTQFRLNFTHPTGSDPAEWPEDLRLREKPEGLR